MQFGILKEIELDRAEQYRDEGIYYQTLTLLKKVEEDSISSNKKWNNLYKRDARQLWSLIGWKEKSYMENENISANIIHKFFSAIFQSPILSDRPTLQNNVGEIQHYQTGRC